MAVIIPFPAHVRMFAESAEQENSTGAVVLPFARVRKARARDRAADAVVAEGQRVSCPVTVGATSARTD